MENIQLTIKFVKIDKVGFGKSSLGRIINIFRNHSPLQKVNQQAIKETEMKN